MSIRLRCAAYGIALHEVFDAAVRGSNRDVGARTIEINARRVCHPWARVH